MYYFYDGAGRRVQEVSTYNVEKVFVYDVFGQMAAEYSIGAQSLPCTTCYIATDHLGSTRLVTDQNANVVGRHDYLPFGEEIAANTGGRNSNFGTQDFVNQKFTGQERDSETGLDFFQARYFSGALGRFNSPDPSNAGANLFNPQSWNGYTYVNNDPLDATDPTGMIASLVQPPKDPWSPGGALFDFWHRSIDRSLSVLQQHTQLVVATIQLSLDWLAQPRDQGCMSGQTAAGAGAGMAGGAALGSIFGPADVLTVPMGATAGMVGGAAFGRIGGLITCMSSTGGGGNGEPSTGPTGEEKPTAQLKKLSPAEIRKLEVEGGAHQIKSEALGTNKGISQYDLYKDTSGNIYVTAKGGNGEAIPTGLNINHF
jgi:RHS repeat-associated protein